MKEKNDWGERETELRNRRKELYAMEWKEQTGRYGRNEKERNVWKGVTGRPVVKVANSRQSKGSKAAVSP